MRFWVFFLLLAVGFAQQAAPQAEDKDLNDALAEAGSSQIEMV